MKKIYIAGKINGLKNYREVFKAAEDKLVAEGNTVMNPAVLPEGFDYEIYLTICMLMLQACDAVYMLSNFKDSKGANVELQFAKAQGKDIIYQEINTCLDCKFYDGICCMYDCSCRTVFDEYETGSECKNYKLGNYNAEQLEATDYK